MLDRKRSADRRRFLTRDRPVETDFSLALAREHSLVDETLAQHVPDEGAQLLELKSEIAGFILYNEDVVPGHPLHGRDYTGDLDDAPTLAAQKFNKCQTAILDVSFDVVIVMLSLIGVHSSHQDRVKRAMGKKMG